MAFTIEIRPAVAADVPALRELYRRSSMANVGDRVLFARHPELLDWSDLPVGEGRTWVGVGDGSVVGFATLRLGETAAELEDLFVDPDYMGRGVGRALVEGIAALARAAGRRFVEVDANPHAAIFYTSVGFVAVGEAAVPYGTGARMRRST